MALRTVQAGLTLAITAGLWLPAAVDAHRGGLLISCRKGLDDQTLRLIRQSAEDKTSPTQLKTLNKESIENPAVWLFFKTLKEEPRQRKIFG